MLNVFDVSYFPVVRLATCPVCTLPHEVYGRRVTHAGDAPMVGLDTRGMTLCHGHAWSTDSASPTR